MSEKVGIVYSPGYGAGWSTWGVPEMALDQELAHAIQDGLPFEELEAIAERNWPDEYFGGLRGTRVRWVDPGTLFKIEEYDGNESITFCEENCWMVARGGNIYEATLGV